MVCTGTDGLGHVLVLVFSWGRLPLCVWECIYRNDWKALLAWRGQRCWISYNAAQWRSSVLLLRNIFFVHLAGSAADWCCPRWGQAPSGWRTLLVTREVLCCVMWIFFMAVHFLLFWVLFGNWVMYADDWKEMPSHNKFIKWNSVSLTSLSVWGTSPYSG